MTKRYHHHLRSAISPLLLVFFISIVPCTIATADRAVSQEPPAPAKNQRQEYDYSYWEIESFKGDVDALEACGKPDRPQDLGIECRLRYTQNCGNVERIKGVAIISYMIGDKLRTATANDLRRDLQRMRRSGVDEGSRLLHEKMLRTLIACEQYYQHHHWHRLFEEQQEFFRSRQKLRVR
jgi:hypothetical protein